MFFESSEVQAAENGGNEEDEEGDATIPYAEEIDQNYTGEEDEAVRERWVKNVSSRILSKHEINLLRKGGGYAVTPRELPHLDFITSTECACRNLAKGEALNLRAEIIEELKKSKVPASNLTSDEWKAMKTLREDEKILVLPADKGKCLVVMDKEEYIRKMEEKLSDQSTYKQIDKDPTEKLKTELSNHLNKVKDEGQLDKRTFFKLFPTKTRIPRMYGQPKIHKQNYPLREIVDSTGSAAKECDKYISKIIQKYTGKTEHYIKNSTDFAEKIKDLKVEDDEILVSYDVTALYPSVPQDEAIEIVYQLMKEDPKLAEKTTMSAENVIKLFKICVQTTYFVFNKKLYIQVDGLAIGASSSGPAAELFMVKLEARALATFVDPPKLWLRYVDDTFAKLKKIMVEAFLIHLNSQHRRVKFTTEVEEDKKTSLLRRPSARPTRQKYENNCLQKTNTHRPIFGLKVESPHKTEDRFDKYVRAQSQYSSHKRRRQKEGDETRKKSTEKMWTPKVVITQEKKSKPKGRKNGKKRKGSTAICQRGLGKLR